MLACIQAINNVDKAIVGPAARAPAGLTPLLRDPRIVGFTLARVPTNLCKHFVFPMVESGWVRSAIYLCHTTRPVAAAGVSRCLIASVTVLPGCIFALLAAMISEVAAPEERNRLIKRILSALVAGAMIDLDSADG